MAMSAALLDPVTPGELLWEDFMVPMGLSRYRLAKEIGVPAPRIGDIVSGKRAVTADSDLRLCRRPSVVVLLVHHLADVIQQHLRGRLVLFHGTVPW
jgi:addiction module HigA family antidote